MLVKFENGEKDVNIIDVTPENYIVPENERLSYHCKIEVVEFDRRNGKRLSRPRIQKFGKKIFETNIINNLKKQGYTVEILYNPSDYIKQLEEQKKQNAAKLKEKAEAEMQAKIDAAVEAALTKERSKRTSKKSDNEITEGK